MNHKEHSLCMYVIRAISEPKTRKIFVWIRYLSGQFFVTSISQNIPYLGECGTPLKMIVVILWTHCLCVCLFLCFIVSLFAILGFGVVSTVMNFKCSLRLKQWQVQRIGQVSCVCCQRKSITNNDTTWLTHLLWCMFVWLVDCCVKHFAEFENGLHYSIYLN